LASIAGWRRIVGVPLIFMGGFLVFQHVVMYGYSSEPGPCHGMYGLIMFIVGFLMTRRFRRDEGDDFWSNVTGAVRRLVASGRS